METKSEQIEALFEKAEDYAKINLNLFRLKTIDKSADFFSNVVAKLAIILAILIVILLLSIALALWLGQMLGASYYGFLIVAGLYIVIALILNIKRGSILKAPINDFIITQMLKEKKK